MFFRNFQIYETRIDKSCKVVKNLGFSTFFFKLQGYFLCFSYSTFFQIFFTPKLSNRSFFQGYSFFGKPEHWINLFFK